MNQEPLPEFSFNQLDATLSPHGYVAILWHVDDIWEIRPDLTRTQCMEVLKRATDGHDATMGINWDTLEFVASDLFPPKDEP
jgi:hypothetical protein